MKLKGKFKHDGITFAVYSDGWVDFGMGCNVNCLIGEAKEKALKILNSK